MLEQPPRPLIREGLRLLKKNYLDKSLRNLEDVQVLVHLLPPKTEHSREDVAFLPATDAHQARKVVVKEEQHLVMKRQADVPVMLDVLLEARVLQAFGHALNIQVLGQMLLDVVRVL